MTQLGHWRMTARKVIEPIWEKHGRVVTDEFYKEVSATYPFGPRSHYPYQVWLDEIKVITGKRKFNERKEREKRSENMPKEQMKLW
jgi:hypothetical protein